MCVLRSLNFFPPEVVGEGLLLLFTRLSRQIFCYLAHIGGVSNLLKRKKKKSFVTFCKMFLRFRMLSLLRKSCWGGGKRKGRGTNRSDQFVSLASLL